MTFAPKRNMSDRVRWRSTLTPFHIGPDILKTDPKIFRNLFVIGAFNIPKPP
jgi:hypothetical protein